MPTNSSNLPDGVEDITAPDSLELETLRRSLIDFYQTKSFQLTYPSLVEFAYAIGGEQNTSLRDSAFTFFDDLSSKVLSKIITYISCFQKHFFEYKEVPLCRQKSSSIVLSLYLSHFLKKISTTISFL